MSTTSVFSRVSFRPLVCFFASLALPLATVAQTATVGVNATQSVRTVDERVFGLNAVMWDGQTSSSQTITMLQAGGVRVIRVPGGSASDGYHWNLNVSDTNLTPRVFNTWTWGAGFDSFSRLINGLNSQAFVTVNYGSGTPEEAAAWVAYANASSSLGAAGGGTIGVDSYGIDWKTAGYWSNLRASAPLAQDDGSNFLRISRSAPIAIKYWEIGNECYGTWEEDLNTANGNFPHDPFTYATRAKAYIAKMKAVDATIKIGVVAVTGEDANSNGYNTHAATNPRTHVLHLGWTPVMLATLNSATAVLPDFLIYHRYDGAPGQESDATLLQAAKTWPNDAANLRQMLNDYLGSGPAAGVELCVTENNSVYSNPGKQTTSLVDGLYLADSIGNVLQTEFDSLVWWDLRNGQDTSNNLSASLYGWRMYGDYGVMSSNFVADSSTLYDAYPTYYVMKLLSNFARGGDTVVAATSNNTLLSIFAAKHSDGTLRLLVINKSATSTITGNIALTGFTPTSTATVYSYGMPQDNAAHAGTGSIDVAAMSASIAGASFSLQFAPYSASVVVLSDATRVQSIISSGLAADFNGDGKADILWHNNVTGDLSMWLMDGSTIIGNPYLGQSGGDWQVAGTGDFNGDGKGDILWRNVVTTDLAMWLMDGVTIMENPYLGQSGGDWQIAGTGDFNGDGKCDILWHNVVTGDLSMWLMSGSTIIGNPYVGQVGGDWQIAGTGDFNGDGKCDILWRNAVTTDMSMWLMDSSTIIGNPYLGQAGTNDWQIAGTGDFNGDGKADILWRNVVTTDLTMWLMDGTTIIGNPYLGQAGTNDWQIAP